MSDQIPLDPHGLHTALASAQAETDLSCARPAVDQPALFALSQTPQPEMARELVSPERGPGRPAGSKNKSSEAWREFLLSRHRSPLEHLMDIISKPLPQLCREMSGSTSDQWRPTFDQMMDCLKLQVACMKEVAPYLHSKQPIAIDGGEHGLINLFIGQGSVERDPAGSHGAIDEGFVLLESESNQALSEDDDGESNGLQSNDHAEGVENE